MVESTAETTLAPPTTEREQVILNHSEFVIKYTAKKRFARLHLRNGCWRAQDERDAVPVLTTEEAEYDEICRLCWPRDARPVSSEGASELNLRTAIRVSAGVKLPEAADNSSTTESSSSSEIDSEEAK